MLELRKDIFADERDDNLKEIGKGTQRQDMLGHVPGRPLISTITNCKACCI